MTVTVRDSEEKSATKDIVLTLCMPDLGPLLLQDLTFGITVGSDFSFAMSNYFSQMGSNPAYVLEGGPAYATMTHNPNYIISGTCP